MAENRLPIKTSRHPIEEPHMITSDPRRHRCPQFNWLEQEKIYSRLQERKFNDHNFICWDTLRVLRLHKAVQNCLPPIWREILDKSAVIYKELTLEFYSTYNFVEMPEAEDHGINFCLLGQWYNFSTFELANLLDVYQDNEDAMAYELGYEKYVTELDQETPWSDITCLDSYDTNLARPPTFKNPDPSPPQDYCYGFLWTLRVGGKRESPRSAYSNPHARGTALCPVLSLAAPLPL